MNPAQILWAPPVSTALLIESWSKDREEHLSWQVEQLVLRRLINTRPCPLCGAWFGDLCVVYGGAASLRRTHDIRIRMTRSERLRVVGAALQDAAALPELSPDDAEDEVA